jgi:hypothetical protein
MIYEYVMTELQDYIAYVQQIYLKLKHVKEGAILSAPNAPAQVDGHDGKLHSDYTANVLECTPDERPVSIIMAVDPFRIAVLTKPGDEEKRYEEIKC